MEDDLHQNNMSKFGKRIDFDMSIWPILYKYKDSTLIYFRKPNNETFKITEHDITHFPNSKDAKPSYWPTHPGQLYSESVNTTLKHFVNLSTNAYPHQANILYQKLENNPIFVYHKHRTFMRYILTNADIYRELFLYNMHDDAKSESQLLIKMLADLQSTRIEEHERILLKNSTFLEFLKYNGEKTMYELLSDIQAEELSIDTDAIKKTFYRIHQMAIITIEKGKKNLISSDLSHSAPVLFNQENESKEKIDFSTVKKRVITAMRRYLNPGFLGFNGFFRKHQATAEKLILLCEKTIPDPNNQKENVAAICLLKKTIAEEQMKLANGGMFIELSNLLTEITPCLLEKNGRMSKSLT